MQFRPYNNSPAYSLSAGYIRRVWAAATAMPQASYVELARELRSTAGNVCAALRVLEAAGYIEVDGVRARRVIVPFALVRREAGKARMLEVIQ